MFRLTIVLVVLTLSSLLIAQRAFGTEVLYVQLNTSILTYDVDPHTLQAVEVGSPLELRGVPEIVQVIPSPDDHFVYVLTGKQRTQVTISVYATDAAGVPLIPAVQALSPAPIGQFSIDPDGRFAYATEHHQDRIGNYIYTIRLFNIDAVSGNLTESPTVQQKYAPSAYCGPEFIRFASGGSTLFDSLFCGYPDSSSETLYKRAVDTQTGQLGPETQIFSFNDSGAVADELRLSNRTINDLHLDYTGTSMLVYPLTINPTNPIIQCTSAMLAACGSATAFWQDTTGKYLLLQGPSTFDVTKVDLVNRQIIETGSTFPNLQSPYFTPDDRIMFGVAYNFNNTSLIQIYGFDSATGLLSQGGQVSVPAILWEVFPARRF